MVFVVAQPLKYSKKAEVSKHFMFKVYPYVSS